MLKLLNNASEEARICILVLALQCSAVYGGIDSLELKLVLFAVLGTYLTLRLPPILKR